MPSTPHDLLADLSAIVSASQDRIASLQQAADRIRGFGGYRWVGLYQIDHSAGIAGNLVWSGPRGPEHPVFPFANGLTGAAVARRQIVNVGEVSADPHYLPTLTTTRSEIIVPVLDSSGTSVVGTIDVESEQPNAFSADAEALLASCASVLRPLWQA